MEIYVDSLPSLRYGLVIRDEPRERIPAILSLAKEQLHNAVVLLGKGYSVDDLVEPLIDQYGDLLSVPVKA